MRAHPAVARRSPLSLVASPSLRRRSPPPTRGSATRRLKRVGLFPVRFCCGFAVQRNKKHNLFVL